MYAAALFVIAAVAPTPAQLARDLTPDERVRAIAHVATMKADRRGPFAGVSWFCKDGTVLPPRSYACVEHGGGFQYGVLSAGAERLGRLGIHVGTVLTSLPAQALIDVSHNSSASLLT